VNTFLSLLHPVDDHSFGSRLGVGLSSQGDDEYVCWRAPRRYVIEPSASNDPVRSAFIDSLKQKYQAAR